MKDCQICDESDCVECLRKQLKYAEKSMKRMEDALIMISGWEDLSIDNDGICKAMGLAFEALEESK